MTCKRCIHFDACSKHGKTKYYGIFIACNDVEERCEFFKDKAYVDEIVRCKKCAYYNPARGPSGFGWCEYYNSGATDDHYCSHGEREGN